jgi:hypothetical protein
VCHDIAERIIAARDRGVSENKTINIPAPVVKVPRLHATVTAYDGELSPVGSAVSISPTTTTSYLTDTKTIKSPRSGELGKGPVEP